MTTIRLHLPAALLLLTLWGASPAYSQARSDAKLESAIAKLRFIDASKLNDAQKEAKAQEIDAAWIIIRAAGKQGVAALKQELQRVKEKGEKDDFFKLNAAALLWQIGRFDEVAAITEIWQTTPLDAQYNYVFLTALDAAQTQDPRVLPMLEACLRDNKGHYFVAQHAMRLDWPKNLIFLWGIFGPKGLPALARLLQTSSDTLTRAGAIYLLDHAQYVAALPQIRKIAGDRNDPAQGTAIRALGIYGHPQDFDLLLSFLRASETTRDLEACAYALYEFEDLRAVAALAPFLGEDEEYSGREVHAALTHLLSVASLNALQRYCVVTPSGDGRFNCDRALEATVGKTGRTWEQYGKLPAAQRAALVAGLRQQAAEDDPATSGKQPATHEAFVRAANEWKQKNRLDCGACDEEALLLAAVPEDIDLLLEVKAAVMMRLSDECLYEAERIDRTVRRLGRSRYRKVTGLTEKAEAR
ncbi:MAG TPA: HEAT repeat domain-containing protein [Blastocatellia bacterium]|nr:HEAT repeat domain-containing protein [Blastocatellia bacterium]